MSMANRHGVASPYKLLALCIAVHYTLPPRTVTVGVIHCYGVHIVGHGFQSRDVVDSAFLLDWCLPLVVDGFKSRQAFAHNFPCDCVEVEFGSLPTHWADIIWVRLYKGWQNSALFFCMLAGIREWSNVCRQMEHIRCMDRRSVVYSGLEAAMTNEGWWTWSCV